MNAGVQGVVAGSSCVMSSMQETKGMGEQKSENIPSSAGPGVSAQVSAPLSAAVSATHPPMGPNMSRFYSNQRQIPPPFVDDSPEYRAEYLRVRMLDYTAAASSGSSVPPSSSSSPSAPAVPKFGVDRRGQGSVSSSQPGGGTSSISLGTSDIYPMSAKVSFTQTQPLSGQGPDVVHTTSTTQETVGWCHAVRQTTSVSSAAGSSQITSTKELHVNSGCAAGGAVAAGVLLSAPVSLPTIGLGVAATAVAAGS